MKINLDHIAMNVKNIELSKEFYSKIFGFQKVEEGQRLEKGELRKWLILQKESSHLCLYEKPIKETQDSEDAEPLQIYHFGLRIGDDDLSNWKKVLETERPPLLYGGPVSYPHSTSWYVIDPSGYEIEVSHWPQGLKF